MTHSHLEIEKMMGRFRRVGMHVDQSGGDLFLLYGARNDWVVDGLKIFAPGGTRVWTLPQLYNLLALIFVHGRPSKYELTLRERDHPAQFKMSILVQAGADPFEIAGDIAACRQCVVHELWRVEG